jgi:hypothetical protein
MNESVLDRLQNVHPDLEIWWDSSRWYLNRG